MLKRLSVKSKVVLMLLSVSLLSALVVGILGWRSSRTALSRTIFDNMTAIRRGKAEQLEAYFRNMRYAVEVLSEDDMIIEAMVRFNRAFRQLENETIPQEWDAALEAYYTSQFFPRFFANLPGQADYDLYRPQNQAGLYLQYQYIVANRFEIGEKQLLDDADDSSEYSDVHRYYHPRLRNLMQKLRFYDIFLINIESGDVVYSVTKEADYASNLDYGPFRRSQLAQALELTRDNAERGSAQLIDFDFYRPSYGAAAAFWAVPLYNGEHLVGILIVQFAAEGINNIMTGQQQWAQVGLGATGETYVIGADHLMRSDARLRMEDPVQYQERLRDIGITQRTMQLIDSFETTVLLQEIDSPAVNAALQNQTGTEFTTNYLEQPVLASYQPVVLEGQQWAIVTEMGADEVFAPIYSFQRQLLMATVLLIVTLAFVAVAIAYLFMRPLNLLVQGARDVSKAEAADTIVDHEKVHTINLHSHDEWGELAAAFNEMLQGVQRQAVSIKTKDLEITRLLHNLLPQSSVQRLQLGEQTILDQVAQITCGVFTISGVSTLVQEKTIGDIATLLQDLMTDINAAAERFDVELLLAPNQQMSVLCGLSTPHLDHSRRVAEFALATKAILQRADARLGETLTLRCGLHIGPFQGSVLQSDRLVYEMWGESVAGAGQLLAVAGAGQLIASQALYERLHEQYVFQKLTYEHQKKVTTVWALVGAKSDGGA